MADYCFKDHQPSLSAWKAPAGLACPSPFPLPRGAGLIQPAGLARPQPGLMEIENIIQYAPFAVGLKPSAIQGEARLRGLWRNNYSKTISPRLSRAKPACAGYGGLFVQRPSARRRRTSPPVPIHRIRVDPCSIHGVRRTLRCPGKYVQCCRVLPVCRHNSSPRSLRRFPSASLHQHRRRTQR
jgi:hypothetical protein